MNTLDKLVRTEFRKAVTPSVAIMWHGSKSIDHVDGVFGSAGEAMAAAGGSEQRHVTQVDVATPSRLTDGTVWVLLNGGGIFSAHCSAADAARAQGISGGRFRSFVPNSQVKSVGSGDMAKAQLAAIKDALGKPQKMLGLKW